MSYGCKHKDVECTKELVEEVARQLATYSIRDSEFQPAVDPGKSDEISIIQEGVNRKLTLEQFTVALERWIEVAKIRSGTTEYWNTSAYVPELGELIIYLDKSNEIIGGRTVYIPGIKAGDGNTDVKNLAFVADDIASYLISHINNHNVHVTDNERQTWNSKYNKPSTGIPASDLASGVIPDVSQFITKSVDDLVNYYLKSETYTKSEVNSLIGAIQSFHYEVYPSLSSVTNPQSNVLYLIGPTGSGEDKYEEYVYSNNTFVKIGDTSIDLSGYVTTTALNTVLAAYTTTADLTLLLEGKQDVIIDLPEIRWKVDTSFDELFDESYDSMAVKMSESFITKFPAVFQPQGDDKWAYHAGLLSKAMLDTYKVYGGSNLTDYVEAYYHAHTQNGQIVSRDSAYSKTNYNLDHVQPGYNLFYLEEIDPTYSTNYEGVIAILANQLEDQPRVSAGTVHPYYHKARYPHQVWLDGLYMCEPFRALLAKETLTGATQAAMYDDIVGQIITAAGLTYDPVTKLFRQAWTEDTTVGWRDPDTDGQSYFCWGRALGWFMMAITDVLDILPSDHSRRAELIAILRGICERLPYYADQTSGVWRLLPTEGTTDNRNILESTSSSMYAYAYLHGVRKGYLPASMMSYAKEVYEAVVDTFVASSNGVYGITNCISAGNPGGTSTTKAQVLENYYSKTVAVDDPQAVGPFILASLDYEALFPDEVVTLVHLKEDKSNKVTSISSTSTDAQYPSAKATYDALRGKMPYYITAVDTQVGSDIIISSGNYAGAAAAIAEGRMVILSITTPESGRVRNYTLYAHSGTNNNINFQADVSGHKISYTINSSNVVTNNSQRDFYENTGNKVTSMSASSTDTQYPSAKCVYNAISGFVTKSVNDLTNYYLKTETYTQTEVNNLIGAIQQFHYEIAASASAVTNPQPNVLYLIGPTGSGADKYEEYVYANSTWTKIGDTSIDLSDYVTTTALNTALADYTTTANLTTLLAGKQDVIDSAHKLDYSLLSNTPTIPDAQIQSDWNQSDNTKKDYIKNKPTIPSVSGLESTTNKVTSLSSSSTDTQYPSAKCVYDIIGDVETLLAAL